MYRSLSSSSRYSASPPTSTLSTSHASQSGGGDGVSGGNHSSHTGVAGGNSSTGGGGGNAGSGGSSYGSSSRSSLSGAGAHRLEQILQNFYLKTAQIITQSRQSGLNHGSERSRGLLRQPSLDTLSGTSTHRSSSGQSRRVNKWFNMEMEDTDDLRDELKLWRATAALSVSPPPPMFIEVFVDCSHLAPSQVPVLLDGDQVRKAKVEGIGGSGTHMGFGQYRRNTILLESWQLTLDAQASSSLPELPTLYKRCIMFFRALYTYTRLLPAYRLCRRLRRSVGQPIPLHIDYRFTTASSTRPDEIQLEMPLTDLEPRNITNTHRFESVDTPAGLFNLQVTYRQYCDLTVNDPEQLLSSRLIDMEENYFSPSLVQESRMRTLLQRDRKRDGELSMPSSPINTSTLHSQPRRSGSPLRSMPASYPNPPPGAFFALGHEALPITTHAASTIGTNATYTDQLSGGIGTSTLPLDDSPIFNSSPISTESRMRTLISQTPSYMEAPLPLSNPIDVHRINRRSSRGSIRSVASRSSSRHSSIVSSSPRDHIHPVQHRASTSSGSAAMTTPSQLASQSGVHPISSTTANTPSSTSNIYAGMVMDRSSSGRPPSFTSMSPHDIFPPRGSPASKGSPSLQAIHPTTSSQGDGSISNSSQPAAGTLPSFTLPFAASIPTQRLSGASISSQDVVPPRTLPVHTGSNTLMRRTSNSQSGTARRGRSNTRQSDESIHSERRLSRGSVRSFTASASQKDVDDVASFVHMIDTHMSIPLSGGGRSGHHHHETSGGLSISPTRSSSEQPLSMGVGNGSSTSLLQDTDHALSRFHQFRDEAMLLTESMQLGHALNSPSSQHVHLTSSNLPVIASTGSSMASINTAKGRGRPTSRPASTNLILPHRRTPSNSSNHHHSEQFHDSILRRSQSDTLENDRDNNSTTLPFASPAVSLSSTNRLGAHPLPPDSPSMKSAPLLPMDRPPYLPADSSAVSLPLPSAVMATVEPSREGVSTLATDAHRHHEHRSLSSRMTNVEQPLSDEALLHGDDPRPDTSLLSQPSREFGGNSLEDEGMIFGLADLSFGERSTGSGGAVGSHRPPHW